MVRVREVAELILEAEPEAVPRARRLVRSALSGLPPEVAADAELVVSELVTNAALHGEAPITVRVLLDRWVRVEVEDARRTAPIMPRSNTEAMTGRGLAMVAALSSGWGMELAASGGKVVWAELGRDGARSEPASQPEVDIEALMAAWSDADPGPGTYSVRLGAVSTELLLSAKAHIDNVVRELTLLRDGEASSGVRVSPGDGGAHPDRHGRFRRCPGRDQAPGDRGRGPGRADHQPGTAPVTGGGGRRRALPGGVGRSRPLCAFRAPAHSGATPGAPHLSPVVRPVDRGPAAGLVPPPGAGPRPNPSRWC